MASRRFRVVGRAFTDFSFRHEAFRKELLPDTYFEANRQLPEVRISANGRYQDITN